jgi:hypothetical protein
MVNLNTVVDVQVTKRKKLQKNAKVIEAFKNKHLKVELDDHTFHLLWNAAESKYAHKFLDIVLSCEYEVEKDFTAVIKKQGYDLPPIKVNRKKSGRPESLR